MRVLRKRKWMILIVLLLFTAVAGGGTFAWRANWPGYTATALIRVRLNPEDPMSPDAGAVTNVTGQGVEEYVNTKALEIRTFDVFTDAAKSELLQKTTWYKQLEEQKNAAAELMEEVSISPAPNSHLIQISFSGYGHHYQDDTWRIVNAIAIAATKRSESSTQALAKQRFERLKDERDDLAGKRRTLISDMRAVSREADKEGGLDNVQNQLNHNIALLQARLLDAESDKNMAQQMYFQSLQQQRQGVLQDSAQVRQIVEAQWDIQNLRNQANALEREIKVLVESKGSDHRSVRSMQVRWEAAIDQLNQRRAELAEREANNLLTQQENFFLQAQAELENINQEIADEEAKLRDVAEKAARVEQYKQDAEEYESRIELLDKTLLDFRLVVGEEQGRARAITPPLEIVQRANEPEEISSPKFLVTVPLGIFLGLAIGVGLAFLLEFTDTSVKSPSDLLRKVDLPMLGMIPHLDDLDESISDPRMAALTNPHSLISEAFRQIRTNILFSGPAEQRRSLLVTSPSPEDGRTSVAVNLAATMTAGGRRVLIVDANFRQPSIQRLFPQCPDGGLSSALVGEGTWKELVAEVEPGLSVMAAGPLPPNPAELLDSEQMSALLEEMVAEYDQVIFDGPPAMVVTDASILSSIVDGTVLVVRAGDNTYGIVQRTRDNLERVGAHITGAVLNGVRVAAGGYLRRNYATFYDYQDRAKLPAK
jgi:capsular exopolysaccharide synthesis family protein